MSRASLESIKNNMPDSPIKKKNIKDKSVVLRMAASLAVSLHVMRSLYMLCVKFYASICDKGHFGI